MSEQLVLPLQRMLEEQLAPITAAIRTRHQQLADQLAGIVGAAAAQRPHAGRHLRLVKE